MPIPIAMKQYCSSSQSGAAVLAGVLSLGNAEGGLVQILMPGNFISETTLSIFDDLTGDGISDMSLSYFVSVGAFSVDIIYLYAPSFNPGFWVASAVVGTDAHFASVNGVWDAVYAPATGTASTRGFITGTFTDANINGGASTPYFLELTAKANRAGLSEWPGDRAVITLDRIVFDAEGQGSAGPYVFGSSYSDYTPIPEPTGGALSLLAAGAIGVHLCRRQRQRRPIETQEQLR